jgi:hypothetical protein
MTKTNPDEVRRRALERAEQRTHERLLTLRSELDLLVRNIDKLTIAPRYPRLMAADAGLDIGNIIALAAARKRRQT